MFRSKKDTVSLIPDGEYEALVHTCAMGETMSGMPVLSFDFLIRKDVEQACGGRHVFKKFYPDGNGEWPEDKIGRYANALGVPDNIDFEPWELVNRKCIVVISTYERDDGEKRNCIFYLKPSKVSDGEEFDAADSLPDFNISEDDIPFN